jgi:hypothetical protein
MMLKNWDICITDRGPGCGPERRYTARAIRTGTTKVIYGTGDSERMARLAVLTNIMGDEMAEADRAKNEHSSN